MTEDIALIEKDFEEKMAEKDLERQEVVDKMSKQAEEYEVKLTDKDTARDYAV